MPGMARSSLGLVWLVLVLFLTGCQSLSDKIPLQLKSAKEKEIATLRADFAAQMDAKTAQINAQFQQIIDSLKGQIAGATNGLYGANATYATIPEPDRDEIIVNDFVNEAWVALGHSMPTFDQMVKINQRLKDSLDATKTSLDDLRKTHSAAVSENQKLSDATKQALDKLVALQAERDALERDYRAKLDKAQGELADAQNRVIALEKARADDAAAIQALKSKISLICGGLTLACIVAAIYLPVGRGVAIAVGLIAAAGGSLIWIITGPQVLAGCGVLLLGAIGWLIYKHNQEHADATGVYRAVQAFKTESGDLFKQHLAPKVKDFLGRYTKGGKVVANVAAEARIDQRLMQVGDL